MTNLKKSTEKWWQRIKKLKKRQWAIIIAIFGIAISLFLFYRAYQILPSAAINLLSDIAIPGKGDRVMIFSPHPDDETLGAAGLIKKSLENSADVKIVVVSDGDKRGKKEKRHEESIKAMGILGLAENKMVFMDLPDGKLDQVENLDNLIDKEIENYQPTIILTSHQNDIHKDHAAVGKAVDKTINSLKKRPTVYEYLIHYHRFPRPNGYKPDAFLLPPARLIFSQNQWQRLMLDKKTEELKKEAVDQYKTQTSIENPVLRQLMHGFVRQNELFAEEK